MAITIKIQPADTLPLGKEELIWWDRANNVHVPFRASVVAIMSGEDYGYACRAGKRPTDWLGSNNIQYGIYRANHDNDILVFFKSEEDAMLFRLSL
jgi:hypothetical protein